jgi:hypothetical protein
MRTTAILGIVLALFGAMILLNEGLSYRTREKVLDIGPIEAHRDVRKTLPMSPALGALMLAGGATLLVIGMRRAH